MNSATTLKVNSGLYLGFGVLMAFAPQFLVSQFNCDVKFDYDLTNTFLNWGITNIIAAGLIQIVRRIQHQDTTSATHFALMIINALTATRNFLNMDANAAAFGAKDTTRMYINTVLFAFLAYSNLKNWQSAGSKVPKLFNLIDGQNDMSTNGLRLFAIMHLFFGYMLVFQQGAILKQFGMEAATGAYSVFLTETGYHLLYLTLLLICVHSAMDGDVHYALNRFAWVMSLVWTFVSVSNINAFVAMKRDVSPNQTYNAIIFFAISFVNAFAVTGADAEDHRQ